MQVNKLSAVMAAVVAAAVGAFAATPSEAQTTTTQVRQKPIRVAAAVRPPARVTVRKRSYLDPGTETKPRAEHYHDYIYSPTHGFAPFRNSTLFTGGASLPFIHDRMPFPNCLDLPGFCQ
jgi:hypothetical protein